MYKCIVFLAIMTTHNYYFISFCCCIYVFFTKYFWWLLHIAICYATNTSMDIFCTSFYCCILLLCLLAIAYRYLLCHQHCEYSCCFVTLWFMWCRYRYSYLVFVTCYWLLQFAIYYASNTVNILNDVVYVVLIQLFHFFMYYWLLHIAICYASNTMDIFWHCSSCGSDKDTVIWFCKVLLAIAVRYLLCQ